ncbi:hypothetical protein M5K25_001500 [Dendrobium thyrsiflorum]|uniref:Uncharacterized protein n=1 Tax=Dendrobium thyrsiflorum TaxID=117978 RepID=A0ABD0VZX8_DENTH
MFCVRPYTLLKARRSAQGPTLCSRPDILPKARFPYWTSTPWARSQSRPQKSSNGLKTDHSSPLIRDTRHSPPPNQGQSIPGGFDSTSSTQVNVIEQGSDIQPRKGPTSLVDSLDLFHSGSCLVARLSPVVGLSSDIYPTLNFLRSPDFYPSSDSRRTSTRRQTSTTLEFCQSQDSCLVARLSPVVVLSSAIYPMLNFLRSSDFCLSPDFCDAGLSLSPVVGLLPVVGLSSDIYLTLNFLRSPDFCPSSGSRRTSIRRQTSTRCRIFHCHQTYGRRQIFIGLLADTELPLVIGLSSDIYPTLNFLRSPDFCPSPDSCDAVLSPVTGLLPRRQTFARRWTSARRRTFVGHLPDTEFPPVTGLLPVAGLLRRWTFASHRTAAPSPDFRSSSDFCP